MTKKLEQSHLPYKDNPAVQEVFADSLQLLSFNGQFAHLTLTVNRLEDTPPGEDQKGTRSTAARLVMSPGLLTVLYNKLSEMVGALEQQGLVTRSSNSSVQEPTNPRDVN